MNCLWFDEVWTVRIAEIQGSPWEIFYALNHSNNNHLNTLYLYFLGGQSTNWVLYRLPAIIAGVGTVFLAGRIASSQGRGMALLTMFIMACSYPLIHYSSEARGYGTALFFDLLAFDCLRRLLATGLKRFAIGYWIGCIGSLLSHYMFVSLFGALVVWSIAEMRREGMPWKEAFRLCAWLQFVPVTSIVIMYLLDIQHMIIGGAPDYSLANVLTSVCSLTIGGPPDAMVMAVPALILFAIALVNMYRSGTREWLFYLLAVVVMPGALLLVERPQALFVRYFLASILFALLLLPRFLPELWSQGVGARGIVVAFLAGFLYGNGTLTAELLRHGRGDYFAAIKFMADQTRDPVVAIDSDHHDRNAMLVNFYARFFRPERFIGHVRQDIPLPGPTEWYIVHRLPGEPPPPRELTVRGVLYDQVRHDPSCALSGWDWFIFRIRDRSRRS